ncbi:Ankyrin repeat protein [Theobroma cacao]|uniref:Ankyrin repeat protein n=1 Tax=Theobroma cacao TaxID=3641 RepID=A0A061F8R4_THECC|nr:Ankyrin repeat protein [Theobroma cacao]
MDDRLIKASQVGDIDALYELIWEDDNVLKRIDEKMFVDSPLHIAASFGQTRFAMEMMNLIPSFSKKLNKSGFSPMHLALINGHFELVSLFLHADAGLVRVKGRGGLTPLHYAIKNGNLNFVAKFLLACPESIEDVTVRGETVLHIAIKSDMLEALEVLVRWFQRICHKDALDWLEFIPNWKDEEGNTALDIAVSNSQIQAIKLLAEINAKNCKGAKASQILQLQNQSHRRVVLQMLRRRTAVVTASSIERTERLTGFLRSKTWFGVRLAVYIKRYRMRISGDVFSATLVVAGLILAATFQIIYNPPGSFRQYNNDAINTNVTNNRTDGGPSPGAAAGTATMIGTFQTFLVYLTLYFAATIIGLLVPDGLFGITLAALLLYLSCYSMSLAGISPYTRGADFTCLSLCFIAFAFLIIHSLGKKELHRLICFYNAKKCPREPIAAEVQGNEAAAAPGEETGPEKILSA